MPGIHHIYHLTYLLPDVPHSSLPSSCAPGFLSNSKLLSKKSRNRVAPCQPINSNMPERHGISLLRKQCLGIQLVLRRALSTLAPEAKLASLCRPLYLLLRPRDVTSGLLLPQVRTNLVRRDEASALPDLASTHAAFEYDDRGRRPPRANLHQGDVCLASPEGRLSGFLLRLGIDLLDLEI